MNREVWYGPMHSLERVFVLGKAHPWHPALPALAKLLNDEPGLADAVESCLAIATDNQWWEMDVYNSDRDLVQRLAAALATKDDGDGDAKE